MQKIQQNLQLLEISEHSKSDTEKSSVFLNYLYNVKTKHQPPGNKSNGKCVQ